MHGHVCGPSLAELDRSVSVVTESVLAAVLGDAGFVAH